ncbi:cytohesin-1 [Chironomus tepperi]|uniref:cytohesin-1 n=1 Tax=Chironomus tepperi TaxID=113505 RepID=UPI00391FB9A1
MFSNDKKPRTNWFFSLRRQPKKQKSLDSSKLLQKSCVDLSNAGVTGGSSEQDLLFHTKPSKLKLNNNSSNNNNNDDGLSSNSNSCTNCCCKFSSKTSSPSFGVSPIDDIEQCDQMRRVLITNEENYSAIDGDDDDYDDVETSERLKRHHQKLQKQQPKFTTNNFSNNILLYNKKEEFSRTTRTVTTRVVTKATINGNESNTIVTTPSTVSSSSSSNGRLNNSNMHHRIGLVFNENGQLINRRQLLNAKNRDGLIFDECGQLLYTDNDETSSSLTPISVLDDSTIEFIDSSSQNSDIQNRANLQNKCSCNGSKLTLSSSIMSSCKSEWNCTNNKQQIKDELSEVVQEMESHESESKHSSKEKQMSIGRKKFNMDPKKGIEYLYENHLLKHDPQDVAQFLYKGEGLNKTAIGDYLGEKNPFNEKVLKAFVELHDFTNLILVQALRQFLWSFRLPGEAQKIDRMMECFAQRYCQLNPDIFTNADTCYVLSFAIIMLNTSLHNPSVKDKPTVEQFISMNRGINNGGDLPRELLESLYESIRTEPFKIPQDDGNDLMHTFFNPDKEGWLWKQGGRYKSWKRRWFILNDNCLYYFEFTTDKEPRGIIPLENIMVRECKANDKSKQHCFELYATGGAEIIKACKTDSEGKVVEGKHNVYRMSAATEEEKNEWIRLLKHSIAHNPFYDILVQRKKKALIKS